MNPKLHNRAALIDRTLDNTSAELYVYRHKFQLRPQLNANTGATASVVGADPLFEVSYLTNANTVTFAQNGLSITTLADTQYGCANVNPVIGLTQSIFCTGHSTTRATSTLNPTFKTGAAADADSGRGIKFVWPIVTGANVSKVEFLCGMIAGMAGSATTHDKLGLIPAAATKFSASTVYDGFAFYVDNSAGATTGTMDVTLKGIVASGSSPAISEVDLKIYLKASTRYVLEAELLPDRKVRFRVNGGVVGYSTASVDASTSLVPVLGFKTYASSTGAERSIVVGEPTLYKKVIP